jgi:hypothetical protein
LRIDIMGEKMETGAAKTDNKMPTISKMGEGDRD